MQIYNQKLNSNKTQNTLTNKAVEITGFNWNWISLKKIFIYKMNNKSSRFVYKMGQKCVINDIQQYRVSLICDLSTYIIGN